MMETRILAEIGIENHGKDIFRGKKMTSILFSYEN